MIDYARFIDPILEVEGEEFTDDPLDRGGKTKWGITEAVARDWGYEGDMRDLPRELAFRIYVKRYIIEPGFDQVAAISEKIAMELIDTGINMHPSKPSVMLQRWLNGFNDRGRHYDDLFVDGRIGKHTLTALKAYLDYRGGEGEGVMLMALNCTQGERYLSIAENRESQERFLYGWMRARVANILECTHA